MKIRSGFVSNSSSSSFLIVGVENVDKIAEGLKWERDETGEINYNSWTERPIFYETGYGSAELRVEYEPKKPYAFYGSWDQPYYFGVDIESNLRAGERVPDIKTVFIKKVKEDFDISLDWNEVDLFYGEASM